jgi:glycosyltransferase involved in cell wall biosynthesis
MSTKNIARLGEISEPYDLIHCLNQIPLTRKPWIITFEDIIPRTFGPKHKLISKLIRPTLLAPNCHKLVGQSNYALKKFARANQGWKYLPRVLEKTTVIYPSIELYPHSPKSYKGGHLHLVQLGRAFARKGGISALRLAKLAHDCGFPLTMHIVSELRTDGYTDHTDINRYRADLALLDVPNVVFHGSLENEEVLKLLRECHFQYMPTIGDTFGFSVVEGLSVGTPAIVSSTCALPELVIHGKSGYLLDVEVNAENDIAFLRPASDVAYRGTEEYWEHLDRTYTDFAAQSLTILEQLTKEPSLYEGLSAGALAQAAQNHDAERMSEAYDQLYDEALA